jgi:multisubunit Na+/H+ antiporter MnhF subunit
MVSIVMVVRNEEGVLNRKLRNLLGLDYPPERCRIVVVSDGSTDRTEAILREYSRDPRVHVIMNQLTQGKASALNDAMTVTQGEVVIFTDARQTIEPAAIRLLMENFADPHVGCVSGELMLGDPDATETAQGMGHELVTPLPAGTILDDVYLPMQAVKAGTRVVFEPRARAWDCPDLGAGREFGRKVRTLSGNYQLVQIAPWLLTEKNPIRFRFISHKLLRLAVPFALAAALVASVFLSGPIYRTALALQLAFYGLSLLAALRLGRGPLARMADAALTFVILNTAATVAFAKFVTGRKTVWVR